jgi:hypothetical protein
VIAKILNSDLYGKSYSLADRWTQVQTGTLYRKVAKLVSPTLFRADHKGQRSKANFYSSRTDGPLPNSTRWYSLRLNSRSSVLLSTRATNHEESQLSQHAPPSLEKRRYRSHHSPWLLSDSVGKASSLLLPSLREDILLDSRDTLLSASPPARHV